MASKCPACNTGRVESIPISDNDIYRFDYDPKRGLHLNSQNFEKDKGKFDEEGITDRILETATEGSLEAITKALQNAIDSVLPSQDSEPNRQLVRYLDAKVW